MASNFYVNQNIVIHHLKIGGITNSSVFQIGSAGVIKSLSNLYNTGGFVEPAPVSSAEIAQSQQGGDLSSSAGPFVPLKGST
ncbi:spore germination protein GerPB [Sutcliffiella horikoshii]|uniref:spore germination protein GerPB n=1 Tax=Sutcliffiella horikoshii TaxID=79883 RepID=UPI0007D089E8|nr:spore germination protein GerPB [Sutcliffiella horikoshii]MCM3616923.1 spore germination protein GerPB [Sutcliffiella horikoshii]